MFVIGVGMYQEMDEIMRAVALPALGSLPQEMLPASGATPIGC